jgi:hypothetical protein
MKRCLTALSGLFGVGTLYEQSDHVLLRRILPRLRHQVGRLCPEFLGEATFEKRGTDGSV